jgi:hypothetical protein
MRSTLAVVDDKLRLVLNIFMYIVILKFNGELDVNVSVKIDI